MKRALILLIILLVISNRGYALNPVIPLTSTTYWDGTAAVITAEVLDVRSTEDPLVWNLTLEPHSCIAGLFNPAMHPQLSVEYFYAAVADNRVLPKRGQLILIVILDREKFTNGVRKGFTSGMQNHFMPDQLPLVVLENANDPNIMKVLKKVQAARPTTVPSTQPAAPG